MKKVVAMVLCCFFAFCSFSLVNAETASRQNSEINSISQTALIELNEDTIIQAKNEAASLKKYHNYLNRIGYYLYERKFDPLSHGMRNVESQEIALITPYSFAKYLYFIEGASFKEPNPSYIQKILNKNDIVYIAIDSNDTDFGRRYGFLSAPKITNVVLKINNKIYQPLEVNVPSVYGLWQFNNVQLFAFPIELFKESNTPFEILFADSWTEQSSFKITKKKLSGYK